MDASSHPQEGLGLRMASFETPTKPCHTCRRKRLRCDRSLPVCNKCNQTGQECLGYQGLFLWNKGVASRGKMMGKTFEDMRLKKMKLAPATPGSLSSTNTCQKVGPVAVSSRNAALYSDYPGAVFAQRATPASGASASATPPPADTSMQLISQAEQDAQVSHKPIELTLYWSLTDPLFQDLDQDSKSYLAHFGNYVCKDLVIYDLPNQNPFRDLIPLTTEHAVLLYIIIAISALHISNASRASILTKVMPSPSPNPDQSIQMHDYVSTRLSENRPTHAYQDALMAKHRALQLLNRALNEIKQVNLDIILASVLLFIEFELIDSGKDDWRLHINGARRLIECLEPLPNIENSSMTSLRRCLVSNYLVYDILGSTVACSRASEIPHCGSLDVVSILRYAEANNYLSCPAILLQIVLSAPQLLQTIPRTSTMQLKTSCQVEQAFILLQAAQSFDALAWATALQHISPHSDLENRRHIASAHKAAVCIYVSRLLLSTSLASEIPENLEHLVSDIVHHLSFIPAGDALFKSTSWPTFIAGAETKVLELQAWAMTRLHALWELLPWGYIRSAMEILEVIWQKRSIAMRTATDTVDWVQELRMLDVKLLIA